MQDGHHKDAVWNLFCCIVLPLQMNQKIQKTLEQIHIHVIYVVHKIEKILQDVTARTLSMKTEKVWLGLG